MRLTAETAEEIARARDRMRVDHARSKRRPLVLFFLLAGPGILTMLGENDGPSMISYAATGANYGTSFFVPFVIGTFLMAYVIQEAAMRIGVATGKGHAQLIAERFGGAWAALALLDLLAGNALTLVAEFVAVCSGAAFLGIPKATAVVVSALLVFAAFATRRYFTWERLALVLALGNLVFVPIALRLQPHPGALLHAAFWRPPDRLDAAFLTLVLANVGATVTPWMIFFQQSAVVDKGLRSPDLRHARFDTAIGAALAALAAIAMLAIGAVLHAHGIGTAALRGGADFARVLRPYIGNTASTIFALGMIEAGFTALVTISTSSGYAVGELLGGGKSLNRTFADGPLFYGVIACSLLAAAGVVLLPNAPLFALAIFANVAATIFMAPSLIFLLLIAGDRALMGPLVNARFANAACAAVTAAVCAIGAAYGVLVVFRAL